MPRAFIGVNTVLKIMWFDHDEFVPEFFFKETKKDALKFDNLSIHHLKFSVNDNQIKIEVRRNV